MHWPAVGAGVLFAFLFSFVWYALLFQKPWLRALGIRLEDIEDLHMGKARAYLTALGSYIVMGTALAFLIGLLNLRTTVQGLMLGGVTWIGFNATAFARLVFFEDRPLMLCLIVGGADLATHLGMSAILAAWR